MNLNKKSGFSLIEVVVVVVFFSILIYLSFTNLMGFGENKILDRSTEEVIILLEEAQSKSSTGASYQNELQSLGVYFSSASSVQFTTPSDYQNRVLDSDYQYNWPVNIVCEQIELPDNCVASVDCIIFSKGEGLARETGSLVLKDTNNNNSRKIFITTEGLVYQQKI